MGSAARKARSLRRFRVQIRPTRTMGNGQSREDFAGVLPSVSAAKGSGSSETPPISEAWSAGLSSLGAAEDSSQISTSDPVPLRFGKIVPPGHALQLEENTTSKEASEVVRQFNKAERTDDRFVIPESVRKSRTLDAFAEVCSEISLGFLYVSNLRVARDTAKLRSLGITHVINCCGELKHYEDGADLPPINDAEYHILKLSLRDDANEDLTPFLPQVMGYIASCRQRSQSQENGTRDKVLVHCHQGVSRSCAFAIAYVMLEQQLSYHDAMAMVKRQRAITSPNAAFICQLLEWEKDLQAMARKEVPFALGGLHRLAPHSNYDPGCLVLKRCYEPSTDSSRQRQNVASVRTVEDEQRLLWSQGTFVFQSPITPTDLIVWSGSKCVIPEAVSIATQLAGRLLNLQTLVRPSDDTSRQMKIVQVDESTDRRIGTDIDHFGYDAELRWSQDSAPNLHLPADKDTSDDANKTSSNSDPPETQPEISAPPQLFVLEAIGEQGRENVWDQLTNYDSEDLTADSVFLLCPMKSHGSVEGYVWLGTDCTITLEKVVEAAQKQIQRLQNLPDDTATSSTTSLVVGRQNEESDAFWQLFEAGY